MSRIICFLLFLQCLSNTLSAQELYPAALIPEALRTNAQAVVRMANTRLEFNDKGEVAVEEHQVVTILDPKANHFSTWTGGESKFIHYKSVKGFLYNAAGESVTKAGKGDLREYGSFSETAFSDAKTLVLDLDYGQYPYTVEFISRYTIKGFFMLPDFEIQRFGVAVQQAEFQVVSPIGYAYKWKNINTDIPVVSSQKDDQEIRVWQVQDLPAPKWEPYLPYYGNVYSRVLFAPVNVEVEGYKGAFTDWQQTGRFFYQLNQQRDELSAAMRQQVATMLRGKNTPREKIATLYHYLQTNHRYVSIQIGIGGWQTLDAQFVEANKYGDCKALSNYMKALLKAAGIESQLAIIFASSAGAPEMYDDLPVPLANHMILYVPSENIWLECTSQDNPCGYLGAFTADRQALLLTPQGGQLVRTPAMKAEENLFENIAELQLTSEGHAQVRIRSRMTGKWQDELRHWANTKKGQDLENDFIEKSGYIVSKLEGFSIQPNTDQPETLVQYNTTIQHFANQSGKRYFVPLHKLKPFTCPLDANPARQQDLMIRSGHVLQDSLRFLIPKDMDIENIPGDKIIETAFGRYERRVTRDNGQVLIFRRMLFLPLKVAASRYNEVRQFYLDCAKADAGQMVLVRVDRP